MTQSTKNIIIISVILLLLTSVFIIGRYIGKKSEENKQSRKEIEKVEVKIGLTEKQVDSIYKNLLKNQEIKKVFIEKEAQIVREIQKIVIEKPKDTVCNDLYNKATSKINLLNNQISIKDTIEKKSNDIINNQYNIISKKDSIISYKNAQIDLYKNMKPPPKKIGVGIQVGYGLSVTENKLETRPYIGLGVSYNIFNF